MPQFHTAILSNHLRIPTGRSRKNGNAKYNHNGIDHRPSNFRNAKVFRNKWQPDLSCAPLHLIQSPPHWMHPGLMSAFFDSLLLGSTWKSNRLAIFGTDTVIVICRSVSMYQLLFGRIQNPAEINKRLARTMFKRCLPFKTRAYYIPTYSNYYTHMAPHMWKMLP